MQEETQIALLEKLGQAIVKVSGLKDDLEHSEMPRVFGPGHARPGSSYSLIWTGGVYDWTCITMGSCLKAGQEFAHHRLNYFDQPTEPEIQAVIDEIEAAGGYLEAENGHAVSICCPAKPKATTVRELHARLGEIVEHHGDTPVEFFGAERIPIGSGDGDSDDTHGEVFFLFPATEEDAS